VQKPHRRVRGCRGDPSARSLRSLGRDDRGGVFRPERRGAPTPPVIPTGGERPPPPVIPTGAAPGAAEWRDLPGDRARLGSPAAGQRREIPPLGRSAPSVGMTAVASRRWHPVASPSFRPERSEASIPSRHRQPERRRAPILFVIPTGAAPGAAEWRDLPGEGGIPSPSLLAGDRAGTPSGGPVRHRCRRDGRTADPSSARGWTRPGSPVTFGRSGSRPAGDVETMIGFIPELE